MDNVMIPSRERARGGGQPAIREDLQEMFKLFEPMLRRVVAEEVESIMARSSSVRCNSGLAAPPRNAAGPNASLNESPAASSANTAPSQGRLLRLTFRSKLSAPLFTGSWIEGEDGEAVTVFLEDVATGKVVTTGPAAGARLEVVVVEGDFAFDDNVQWSADEFESAIVRARDGKRQLLTGDTSITLESGVGRLGELCFMDNSSWVRSRKFRLGVRVASGTLDGLERTVREGRTEAFIVKDNRGETYKKHYPPALDDELWRLEGVGKEGAFHQRLGGAGINTVGEFLRLLAVDPRRLRRVMGSGVSCKVWEALVEHAQTCPLTGKIRVYQPKRQGGNEEPIGIVFNCVFQQIGILEDGRFVPSQEVTAYDKALIDRITKAAYDHWDETVEWDGARLTGDHALSVQPLPTNLSALAGKPSLSSTVGGNPSLGNTISSSVAAVFRKRTIKQQGSPELPSKRPMKRPWTQRALPIPAPPQPVSAPSPAEPEADAAPQSTGGSFSARLARGGSRTAPAPPPPLSSILNLRLQRKSLSPPSRRLGGALLVGSGEARVVSAQAGGDIHPAIRLTRSAPPLVPRAAENPSMGRRKMAPQRPPQVSQSAGERLAATIAELSAEIGNGSAETANVGACKPGPGHQQSGGGVDRPERADRHKDGALLQQLEASAWGVGLEGIGLQSGSFGLGTSVEGMYASGSVAEAFGLGNVAAGGRAPSRLGTSAQEDGCESYFSGELDSNTSSMPDNNGIGKACATSSLGLVQPDLPQQQQAPLMAEAGADDAINRENTQAGEPDSAMEEVTETSTQVQSASERVFSSATGESASANAVSTPQVAANSSVQPRESVRFPSASGSFQSLLTSDQFAAPWDVLFSPSRMTRGGILASPPTFSQSPLGWPSMSSPGAGWTTAGGVGSAMHVPLADVAAWDLFTSSFLSPGGQMSPSWNFQPHSAIGATNGVSGLTDIIGNGSWRERAMITEVTASFEGGKDRGSMSVGHGDGDGNSGNRAEAGG